MAADIFSWNIKNSVERQAIERFLNEAQVRLNSRPGTTPLTVSWLRGMLDCKPSEIQSPD